MEVEKHRDGRAGRALTGLAVGALLGAALLGVFFLGTYLGQTNAAYALFEWLVRVLPGPLVIFGPWAPAELRQPLSPLTWVLWRYQWPWGEGEHVFGVRAYDGAGVLQIAAPHAPFPSGATGIDTMPASILPG